MKLSILGPPGSGKGTQSDKIAEHYDIPHISTGEMFRTARKRDTELGQKVAQLLENGELVPDHITNEVVDKRLAGLDGFILDGYPRNIDQARHLDGVGLDHAILLKVSDAEVIHRITGRRYCEETGETYNLHLMNEHEIQTLQESDKTLTQRDDSKPDVVKKRLTIYHEETEPVIDYYRDNNLLIEINGEQPIQKVFNDIIQELTA